MRIVSLDIGDATVGVAACDELEMTVNPITVIRRSDSIKADVRACEELICKLGAEAVVVGIPLDAAGKIGPQAKKVMEFRDRLKRRMKIPFYDCDERFTTTVANEWLLKSNVSRKKRREVIDAMAAVAILENYLGK